MAQGLGSASETVQPCPSCDYNIPTALIAGSEDLTKPHKVAPHAPTEAQALHHRSENRSALTTPLLPPRTPTDKCRAPSTNGIGIGESPNFQRNHLAIKAESTETDEGMGVVTEAVPNVPARISCTMTADMGNQ